MRGRNTEFPQIRLPDDHSLFSEALKDPEPFSLYILPVPGQNTVPQYVRSVSAPSSHRFHQRMFSGIYPQPYCKGLCIPSHLPHGPELRLLLQTVLWNMQNKPYRSDHLELPRNNCLLLRPELPSHQTAACSSRYNPQNTLS